MSSATGAACSGGDQPAVKSVDAACISFGTHLSPEKQDRNVVTTLKGADLWHQFNKVGTEMIITKSGRRIFPDIVISVGGLDPELKYTVALEFNPVDNTRYKFIKNNWLKIGEAETHCEEMLKYVHPESPSTGKHWMACGVSFKKIKVTNNKHHKSGQIVCLNSMHKYTPRVVISHFVSKKNIVPIYTHDLVECSFIGVTAYQNDQITQLKIYHNPYAKAFRDTDSDNESYAGAMSTNQWPPMSPLLSPYGTFSPDGQDHHQIQSTRLMAQNSSPIPPLLYSPTGDVPIPVTVAATHPGCSSPRPPSPPHAGVSNYPQHFLVITSKIMEQE